MVQCGLITLEGFGGGLVTPIADGFRENGCNVKLMSKETELDFSGSDFVLVYGPMQTMTWLVLRLSRMDRVPPLTVWFTEQLPRPSQPSFLTHWEARLRYFVEVLCVSETRPRWLRHSRFANGGLGRIGRLRALGELLALKRLGLLRLVCVFTEMNQDSLRRQGLPVARVPLGYHAEFGKRLDLERDIDVVFLGTTLDRRRQQIVRDLERKLSTKGIRFVVKDGSREHGYVFGNERITLLNRTKIMLNIMRQPWDDPIFRILLAVPNGALLLSETLAPASMGPYEPGRHFVMADVKDMADAIEFYLARKEERLQVVEQAYEFVVTELTMSRMARQILANLDLAPGPLLAS